MFTCQEYMKISMNLILHQRQFQLPYTGNEISIQHFEKNAVAVYILR